MADSKKNIMKLFSELTQSRYFVSAIWMNYRKINGQDFNQIRGPFRLLRLLIKKDGLTNSEITEILDIKPSSVSLQVKNLEQRGYVERRNLEEDKRVSLIYITNEGRKLIENGNTQTNSITDEIFNGIDEDELYQLENILSKIYKNIEDKSDIDENLKNGFHFHDWNRHGFKRGFFGK